MKHLVGKGLRGDHTFPYSIMYMCGRPVVAREVSTKWPYYDGGSEYDVGGIKIPKCADCCVEATIKITEIGILESLQDREWWWCGQCALGG